MHYEKFETYCLCHKLIISENKTCFVMFLRNVLFSFCLLNCEW